MAPDDISSARALTDDDFAAAMAQLGPFEATPLLAVAVSGGADSLCLALLAARWAASRQGSLLAMTVDHGLRAASAAEAAQVGQWLAARGIAHRALLWSGAKPESGVQEAARAARYGLLAEACREEGILHLLLGHHLEDQAETLLLRLGRGSGIDGLAAMAPVREIEDVRLLRPLLGVARSRMRATLKAAGQAWAEDPSNHNVLFQRVRMRTMLPSLAAEGLTPDRLAATASRLARARAALESATARLAAECLELDPGGFARLDPVPLLAAPEEVALRTLSGLVRCIGGAVFPPRIERLERLLTELANGLSARRSFAHCLFLPRRGAILVGREPATLQAGIAVQAGDEICWNGRFRMRIGGIGTGRIGALGAAGLAELRRNGLRNSLPATLLHTFPALFDENGVSAVPRLEYKGKSAITVEAMAFVPVHPLAGPAGGLVPTANGPISRNNDRAQRGHVLRRAGMKLDEFQ